MLVSIIIPYYNHWQLTHQRLSELYRFAPENVEIILVNDASPDADCRTGAGWWQSQTKRHKIKYIQNEENLGFGGSHNQGAKVAEGDILVFLSNDVVISGDFISAIVEIINKDENVLVGGRVLIHNTGWNVFNFDGKPSLIPYTEGWMIACTRKLWDAIGGFDPIFAPHDYEDVDVSLSASQLGYRLVPLNSQHLKHLAAGTLGYTPERRAITEQNRIKFFNKWKDKIK